MTHADLSARLWAAYQRHEITWADLQAAERDAQPRCTCGEPTNAATATGPICPTCLAALYRTVSDSHALVARGRI